MPVIQTEVAEGQAAQKRGAHVFEKGLFMTRAQSKWWLARLTIASRIWCVAYPTIVVLVLTGVLPILCIVVFVTATLAGLLTLAVIAASIARQTPKCIVSPTRKPRMCLGDDEVWRSPPLYPQDVESLNIRAAAMFEEPYRQGIESHLSIKVYDLNADGTPNFVGTGVFSSGMRDIEL